MTDIDSIMDLLDWNKSPTEQEAGIRLAKEVQSINVFLQPCNKRYNKNVWDNCARILSEKTDEELSPYLAELMEWLQDMNWPGAFCILDRLQKYAADACYHHIWDTCLTCARALKDTVWEDNLRMAEKSH